MGRLRATITSMDAARAWLHIDAAQCAASSLSGRPRRHLPGSSFSCGGTPSTSTTYSRRVAAAVFLVVAELAADGCVAAQILCLFLPLLILRREEEIPGQVQSLICDTLVLPRFGPEQPPCDPLQSWCERLRRAHLSNDRRRAFLFALEGPEDVSVSLSSSMPVLRRLFPHKPEGELVDEASVWKSMSAPFVSAAANPALTARDVLVWARAHKYKSADVGGWTGQLLVDLQATQPAVLTALARFWSLSPGRIVDSRARTFLFRLSSGCLLRRPHPKDPRPLSAPSLPRKILSAVDARKARSSASAYCEARGQVGLSFGPALQAYSIFPRVVVNIGGTTCSSDLEAAYQNYTRRGLLDGARSFLSSPEATTIHPQSAAHLARLLDSCLFDAHQLPRTRTNFHRLNVTMTSHALSQGCSSSPTAQAITLASAAPLPPRPGFLRKSAHDDSQAFGLSSCSLSAFTPPPAHAGAAFNTSKSVAVGARADQLVAAGFASRSSSFSTVYGAPVGDVTAWVNNEFSVRIRKVISNLLRAYSCDPEAAILAAHSTGGPGAIGAHWLRTCPITAGSAAWKTLSQLDMEWVQMWIRFACGPDRPLPPLSSEEFIACWHRVFGGGPSCLSHTSLVWSAHKHFTAGRLLAWPALVQWSSQLGVSWRVLARALDCDVSFLSSLAPDAQPSAVIPYLRAEAEQAANAYKTVISRAAETLRSRRPTPLLDRGAVTSIHGVSNGHCNLLVSSLGNTFSHTVNPGRLTPDGLTQHCGLVIALIFGLPIWDALGLHMCPTQCKHCLALASAVPAFSPPASSPVPALPQHSRPPIDPEPARRTLDDHGRHISACISSGVLAGGKWRHDSVVRVLADVSAAVGCEGRYHDGPVFSFGPKQRPADLLQKPDNPNRFPAGEAIDATIGLSGTASAERREADKQRKFASQLALNPQLQFTPFAVTTDGDIGPSAHATMCRWSRALARYCSVNALPPGDPRGEVQTAIARALVRSLVFQIVQWKLHDKAQRELGGRPRFF